MGKIKSSQDPKIKLKRFLEEKANFGEEIGLISVTPLVCGITSQNVDTLRYFYKIPFAVRMSLMTKLEFDFLFSLLVKEGASDKEKCQLFHKNVAEGKKDGRNKERRAKIQSEANSKSPLEICQNIKNKQIRIAMRCLLRNREQVKLSKTVSGSNTG